LAYSSLKVGFSLIRFVGEAAALILCSTLLKVSSFLKDQQGKRFADALANCNGSLKYKTLTSKH
jgi:hypothetical protein